MSDATLVDLKKLSERELLILLYDKVEKLEQSSSDEMKKQHQTDIALAVIKTKMQTWAAVIGFVAGIVGSVLMLMIAKIVG